MNVTTEENLIDRIRELYKDFSKTKKRIADIIINQGYVAAFMSITDLASLAGTTNVTIVSLARELGFSGYAELKKNLQEYYRLKITPHIKSSQTLPERINGVVGENIQDLLIKAFESEINLLTDTFNSIIHEDLLLAVEYIFNARKIYIVAGGVVKPVAYMLDQRLSALRFNSINMSLDNYSLLPAVIEAADQNDVFIVYSFPHYRMIIGGIAQCARIRGAKVICITDSITSPPASFSDIILLCKSASLMFYNSITATISLNNIIATLLVAKTKPNLKHDEQILKVLSHYMTSSPYFSDIETLPNI
jgi:DNA-binding MurR/RpiR family transcriptional regulator